MSEEHYWNANQGFDLDENGNVAVWRSRVTVNGVVVKDSVNELHQSDPDKRPKFIDAAEVRIGMTDETKARGE
jgi:hypothetical protein